MKFANETHKRILSGICDEVVRFQRDSSGKKAAYKEGCGYLGVNGYNQGRMSEIAERTLHL